MSRWLPTRVFGNYPVTMTTIHYVRELLLIWHIWLDINQGRWDRLTLLNHFGILSEMLIRRWKVLVRNILLLRVFERFFDKNGIPNDNLDLISNTKKISVLCSFTLGKWRFIRRVERRRSLNFRWTRFSSTRYRYTYTTFFGDYNMIFRVVVS